MPWQAPAVGACVRGMKLVCPSWRAAGPEFWLGGGNKWSSSLAVGATCGCDVSRLGREICGYVNGHEGNRLGECRAFDREEIRRLAGDGHWRGLLLPEPAGRDGYCDFECMAAALASLGGAVLSGQLCLDATRGLRNVFRVMVSRCGQCRADEPSMRLNPDDFSAESLVQVIGDSFLDWSRDRAKRPAAERKSREPAARRVAVAGR